jgi:hypothetical protein
MVCVSPYTTKSCFELLAAFPILYFPHDQCCLLHVIKVKPSYLLPSASKTIMYVIEFGTCDEFIVAL